jgi:hypothetical protein
MNDLVEVKMTELPKCSFCGNVAGYDGKTTQGGQWGYMCEDHFRLCGRGLGTGIGQRLVLRVEKSGPFYPSMTVGAVLDFKGVVLATSTAVKPKRTYSLFVKEDGKWVRIFGKAAPLKQARELFQSVLMWGACRGLNLELRPAKSDLANNTKYEAERRRFIS